MCTAVCITHNSIGMTLLEMLTIETHLLDTLLPCMPLQRNLHIGFDTINGIAMHSNVSIFVLFSEADGVRPGCKCNAFACKTGMLSISL